MKFKLSAKIILIFLSCLISLLPGTVAAKGSGYKVDSSDVTVLLKAEGQAKIKETIVLKLKEDINRLQINLPLLKNQQIIIEQILVSDPDNKDNDKSIEIVPGDLNNVQPSPMTYLLKGEARQSVLEITIYLEALARRVIVLDYTVLDAVTRLPDAALYQQAFFGFAGEDETGEFSLQIDTELSFPLDECWYNASSNLDFTKQQTNSGALSLTAAPGGQADPLVLSVLMPLAFFTGAAKDPQQQSADSLKLALSQAEQNRNTQRVVANWLNHLVGLLLFLGIALFIVLYLYFAPRPLRLRSGKNIQPDPPQDLPFVTALLLRKRRPAHLLLSVLFDLVEKGVIQISNTIFSRTQKTEQLLPALPASTQYLIRWFFDDMAANDTFSIAQMRRFASHSETSREFRQHFFTWKEMMSSELAAQGLIDREKEKKVRIWLYLVSACYVLFALALFIIFKAAIVWLLLLVPFLILPLALSLRCLTARGREGLAAGIYLLRRLKGKGQALGSSDIIGPKTVFPYALALAQWDRYLKQLPQCCPEKDLRDQLVLYGVDEQEAKTLKSQIAQLSDNLEVIQMALSSSILYSLIVPG